MHSLLNNGEEIISCADAKRLQFISVRSHRPCRLDEPQAVCDQLPARKNRVLREQLGSRPLRFTDDQRRRLAARAKLVGLRLLIDIADLVTPDHCWLGTASEWPKE